MSRQLYSALMVPDCKTPVASMMMRGFPCAAVNAAAVAMVASDVKSSAGVLLRDKPMTASYAASCASACMKARPIPPVAPITTAIPFELCTLQPEDMNQ